MKLSLIVPVYGVEKYILACMKSICMQLPQTGVEVIVVNDETPDASMQIAQAYVAQRSQTIQNTFKWINQKNLGLSGARNTGIDHAQGEYIAFLDSDDGLKPDFFSTILTILTKNEVDIVQFRAERISDDGVVLPFLSPFSVQGFCHLNQDVYTQLFNRSAWFSWLRVYKKSLFEKIRFPLGKNYEDAYTTPFLFLTAKTAYFIHDVLLQYRMNPSGITATKSKKNIDDLGGGALCYLQHIEHYPVLTPTLVAISQSYIYDSLKAEGFASAKCRWARLKQQIQQVNLQENLILNRGNRLFLKFGLGFLLLDLMFRKLGIKK